MRVVKRLVRDHEEAQILQIYDVLLYFFRHFQLFLPIFGFFFNFITLWMKEEASG